MEQQHSMVQEGINQGAIQKNYTDTDGPFLIHVVRLYPTQDGYRERIDRMDVLPGTVEDANALVAALDRWGAEDRDRGTIGGRFVMAFYEPFLCPRPWTRSLLGAFQREMIRRAIEIADSRPAPGTPPDPEYVRMRLSTIEKLMGWKGVTP